MGAYNELLTLMGLNPFQRKGYEDAYGDMDTSRRKRANTYSPGPSGNSFSWFNNPGGLPDFEEENAKTLAKKAAFLAQHGISAEDLMDKYRRDTTREEVIPGGQATQGVGSGVEFGGLSEVPDIGMEVGQRFDKQGMPITTSEPSTIRVKDEGKISDIYKEIQARLANKQNAADMRDFEKQNAVAIGDLQNTYKMLLTTGERPDSKVLTDIKNKILRLQGFTDDYGAEIPEAENKGWSWWDFLSGGEYLTPSGLSNKSGRLMGQRSGEKLQSKPKKDPLKLGL